MLCCLFCFSYAASMIKENKQENTDFLNSLRKGLLTKSGVSTYLQHGADANQADENKWTCLHQAVENQNKYAVIKLIESGAHVNAQTITGWTPLHEAAKQGNMIIFDTLVRNYGCIFLKDYAGATIFAIALENNHKELMNYIQKKMHDKNSCGLLRAYKEKAYKAFADLLDCQGLNVNVQDEHSMTVLHYAAADNNIWAAAMLLEKKGNDLRLDLFDCNGWTPATWARFKGHSHMIELIGCSGYKEEQPQRFYMTEDPTNPKSK